MGHPLFSDRDLTEVRPGIFATTEDTAQLTVTVYRYEPGCAWETHSHPEDQVTYVTAGGIVDFVVAGEPRPLSPGELAIIPGGVPHSASVPADGETVVTLNVWRLRDRGAPSGPGRRA